MAERIDGEIPVNLREDPDIARAIAIIAGAKEEAGKISPGDDPESQRRRFKLTSMIIEQTTERLNHSDHNGKPETD